MSAPSRVLAERLEALRAFIVERSSDEDERTPSEWAEADDTLRAAAALLREPQGYGGRRCVCCDELARHGMLTCHEHREKESDAGAAQ